MFNKNTKLLFEIITTINTLRNYETSSLNFINNTNNHTYNNILSL